MAKLPDPYGQRPAPRSNTTITQDRSGEIVGNALINTGRALGQIAEYRKARQDKFSYAQAKSTLLTADIEARKSLENDEDWATYEKRYRETVAKGLDAAAKLISNPEDRAIFEMDAKLSIERGAGDIRQLSKAKEVDWGRGTVASQLDALRETGLNATDEATRSDAVNTALDVIDGAKERGYLDEEAAVTLRKRWTQDYAEGFIAVQSPDKRIEYLKNPKGSPAEFLPTDQRAKMLEAAEKENKVIQLRADSQTATDSIMAQHSSRADALQAARAIKDPEVRDQAVSRVNQRFNELDAIESEADQERFEIGANIVEQGGSVTDIPSADWTKYSVNQRQALEARARQVATGEEPIHDDAKYYAWSQLSVEEQGKANLMEWRPYFDDAHFNRAVERQRSIQDAQDRPEAKVALTSALTIGQRIDRTLVGSGLFKEKPKAGSGNAPRWAQIESAIATRIEQDSEAQGRKLKPQEIQQHIDDVVMDRYFVDENWFSKDPEVLGVEMTAEQAADAYIPYDEIPDMARTRLENYAKSLNLHPDEDQIAKAYAAGKLGLGDEAILERLR